LVLRPKYVEAENNLGLCWRELNKPDEAKAAFQTAIDWQGDSPNDAQPYLNLGTMLADQGDLDKAILCLVHAAALSPTNPKVHEQLGSAYEAQNNLPKAQGELERAVALAPGTSALHFMLGQIYRKQGLRDLARKEFEICAKLNSTHSSPNTPNPFRPQESAPQ
jgi:tetratricopeptide (TPR) repeat protein